MANYQKYLNKISADLDDYTNDLDDHTTDLDDHTTHDHTVQQAMPTLPPSSTVGESAGHIPIQRPGQPIIQQTDQPIIQPTNFIDEYKARILPDKPGFFYIIQTPDVPANVYKIGKTTNIDPNKRLCRYPRYSSVKYTIEVANADKFEDLVMRKLRIGPVKRRLEFGLEYYECELTVLVEFVHNLWMVYGNQSVLAIDKTIEKNKPNGWQYFANEWLRLNRNAGARAAYNAYVDIMRNVFATSDYCEFEPFLEYYSALRSDLVD